MSQAEVTGITEGDIVGFEEAPVVEEELEVLRVESDME